MYYENKSMFYVKQYGPAAVIITVSIVLISVGTYLGIKTFGITKKATKVETPVEVVIDKNSKLPSELNNLTPFTRSKEYKVVAVNNDNSIVVEAGNKKIDVTLIGVQYKKNSSNFQNKLVNELKDKKITLEFDNIKEENNKIVAYVYLNNNFYNEKILLDGAGELKAERINVNRLDVLLAAEIKSRHEEKGVWKI